MEARVTHAEVRKLVMSRRRFAPGWSEAPDGRVCTQSQGHLENVVAAQWAYESGEAACFSHADDAGVFEREEP